MKQALARWLFILAFSLPCFGQANTGQCGLTPVSNPPGWTWGSGTGLCGCKYQGLGLVDFTPLGSGVGAGTKNQLVCQKYGGTWTPGVGSSSGSCNSTGLQNWAAAQSARMKNLGFNAADWYSYNYYQNYPAGGVLYTDSIPTSSYVIRDAGDGSVGTWNGKDVLNIPSPSGMKCGSSIYTGQGTVDPYDPIYTTAVTALMAAFGGGTNGYPTQANAYAAILDETDNMVCYEEANNPNYSHVDCAYVIWAQNPSVGVSPGWAGGSFTYTDHALHAKLAMRDFFLEYNLCTGLNTPAGGHCTGANQGTGSADPGSGSYVGSTNASNALSTANGLWGTSYTTWNTTDANGLAGISNATSYTGEAFGTGTGTTYSFTYTAAHLAVLPTTYQVYVSGTQVASDNDHTILVPFGGAAFANGNASLWKASNPYSLNNQIRTTTNNCIAIATTGGTSGSSSPSWPTCAVGSAPTTGISDGSVVWTVLGPRPSINYNTGVGILTFTSPPSSGAAITINYQTLTYASWGTGTGFLDENGTGIFNTNVGTNPHQCGGANGNGPTQGLDAWGNTAQIKIQGDAFIAAMTATYASGLRTAWLAGCGSTCPAEIIPFYDGPYTPASASIYAAAAPYVDVFMVAPYAYSSVAAVVNEVQNLINADGGVPVIYENYMTANPDSYVATTCPAQDYQDCQSTQALRANLWTTVQADILRLKNPAGKYAVVGDSHWEHYDFASQGNNTGLFTPNDNGYDGSAASTLSGTPPACAANHAYTKPAQCTDPNGNYESLRVDSCTSAISGTSWPSSAASNYYAQTTDGTCKWFDVSPNATYALIPESSNFGDSLGPIADFNFGLDTGGSLCDPSSSGGPPTALSPKSVAQLNPLNQ